MIETTDLIGQLRRGKANVTSSYEIARGLRVSQRAIGFAVSKARRAGHPIGSIHGEGYYLIETEREFLDTVAHIAARKRGIDETIEALTASFRGRAHA